MIVEEIMKTQVATLTTKHSILDAVKLMEQRKIRHLPIVNSDQHVVGIITDRDIRDATPSIFHVNESKEVLNKPLDTIMKTNIITGHPLDFVEEVAALFYEHNISCLPILKDKKLAGIITETDLLHTLVVLTGVNQPGSQIEIKVPNIAGMLTEIASVIRNRRVNILSVLVYPDKQDNRFKILIFRLQTINPTQVIEDLQNAGYVVLWPNLPGISS